MEKDKMIDKHSKTLAKQWRANFLTGIVPSVCAGAAGVTAWTTYCYLNYKKELNEYTDNLKQDADAVPVKLLKVKIKDKEFILNTSKPNIENNVYKILSIQYFDFLTDEEKIEVYMRITWGYTYEDALTCTPMSNKTKTIIYKRLAKGEL